MTLIGIRFSGTVLIGVRCSRDGADQNSVPVDRRSFPRGRHQWTGVGSQGNNDEGCLVRRGMLLIANGHPWFPGKGADVRLVPGVWWPSGSGCSLLFSGSQCLCVSQGTILTGTLSDHFVVLCYFLQQIPTHEVITSFSVILTNTPHWYLLWTYFFSFLYILIIINSNHNLLTVPFSRLHGVLLWSIDPVSFSSSAVSFGLISTSKYCSGVKIQTLSAKDCQTCYLFC